MVILIAFVGGALIWWSLAVGFGFLVLPIVVCELLLLGSVYLLRRALSPAEDIPQPRHLWLYEPPPASGDRDREGAGTAAQGGSRPARSRPPAWEAGRRRAA